MLRSVCHVTIIVFVTGVLAWWFFYVDRAVSSALALYTEQPYFVAHTAYGHEFPMSSLAGTQAAVARGRQFVDMDVRLSADNIPVVYHDPFLTKTSRSEGMVRQTSFAELSLTTITASEKYQGPDQKIASLARHLEVIKTATGTPVAVIEIKDWSPDIADTAEVVVLDLVERYGLQGRSIIVTAHPLRVCALKKKSPQSMVMHTFVDSAYDQTRGHFFSLPWYARHEFTRHLLRTWCRPDALAIEKTVATSTIESLLAAGYPVFLWSLTSSEDFERAHSLGVFATVGREVLEEEDIGIR
jgi:glycerophosphoryl diester phosphodiesterase